MRNLLVVEDNRKHMKWLLALLRRRGAPLGYEVKYHTESWTRALHLIQTQTSKIDVVIADLQDSATKKFIGFSIIREAAQRGKHVIAVSSFLDDANHANDVLKSGASFYVKKPFKPAWRRWAEYPEELHRHAELSMYFALQRLSEEAPFVGKLGSHVFFSYSTKDIRVASKLRSRLRARKLTCFMAAKDIPGAVEWEPTIWRALAGSRLVLVLFTQNSIRNAWVLCEAGAAVGLGKPILCLLRGVKAKDLPHPLQKYQHCSIETQDQQEQSVRRMEEILVSGM